MVWPREYGQAKRRTRLYINESPLLIYIMKVKNKKYILIWYLSASSCDIFASSRDIFVKYVLFSWFARQSAVM